MVIQLDDTVLAYASASYAEAAAAAAAKDPSAIQRMIDKIKALHRRHGKNMLRHTAVLALVGAAIVAVDKALEYPRVARRLALTTGKLESVTKMAALGFALYKLVSSLLAAVTPADDGYGTPSVQQRIRDLDQRNEELGRHVRDVQEQLRSKVAEQGVDRGVRNVQDVDHARRMRQQEQQDEEHEEEENPDSSYDGPPLPGPLGRKHKETHVATSSAAPTTALSLLKQRFPNAVSTRELYPDIQPAQVVDDVRFLRRIESMDAQRRANYARRLARDPELAQSFVDRTFSVIRRLRRDPVGQKVHRLGTFVVKWATIFAVQAIMFRMLVYVTKANVFNAVGGVTRFALACLCALNSVLVLVHNAGPESEDTETIHRIRTAATRSKALITRLTPT